MKLFHIYLIGVAITAIATAGLTGNNFHGLLVVGVGLIAGAAASVIE